MKARKPEEILKELIRVFDDGAICCDCRVLFNFRPADCGECGILSLMTEAKKSLKENGNETKSSS